MKSETARREIESLDYYLQNHTNDYSEESHTAMMMAIDALSSSEKPNKWIPVSKRLPEKYTYTLWCASSGYVRSDYFNGEFWEDAKKYCYEVIAWMPLPKPYEPQESEG